jgi:hypothetical protein
MRTPGASVALRRVLAVDARGFLVLEGLTLIALQRGDVRKMKAKRRAVTKRTFPLTGSKTSSSDAVDDLALALVPGSFLTVIERITAGEPSSSSSEWSRVIGGLVAFGRRGTGRVAIATIGGNDESLEGMI